MPDTFWESKGQYDPKQFEVKGDTSVAPTEAAAAEAAKMAEEMKKATEMALAAMASSTKASEHAVELGNKTLKDVQETQASIPKKKI